MNFYENTVLSTFGVILGAALDSKSSIKTSMDFMEPLDESAVNYKQLELLKDTDSEDLIKLQELNTILSTQKLSRQNENILINEVLNLEASLGIKNTGIENRLRRQELGFKVEADAAARRKLQDPDYKQLELDVDVNLSLIHI